MTKKNELSVPANFDGKTTVAARSENVGQGSAAVTANDMAIPRLKLLQMINPEVQPGGPEQVQGAQAGMIMNSVNNELFTSVFLINLNFTRKTVVWKKRKQGGGMEGQYDTEAEALASLADQGLNQADYDVSENPTHLVLLLNDDGEPKATALLDMPGTKVKISKIWNTKIAEQEELGNPRYGCVWQLKVVSQSNSSGNFFNYAIDLVAVAPDEMYGKAQAAYNAFFGNKEAKAA